MSGEPGTCPQCAARNTPGAAFCEVCGTPMAPATTDETPAPAAATTQCTNCGATDFADGYCTVCGTPEPVERAHQVLTPATWIAGICDVGLIRPRNEDAMAITADPLPLVSAAITVCDGVSTAPDSHLASQAACEASVDVLSSSLTSLGTTASFQSSARHLLARAASRANDAVIRTGSTPSCTWVGVVIREGRAAVGTIGDSRAYWLPDGNVAGARQLGRDDSWAAEEMSMGVPREQAEHSPRAHMITRWLGADAPPDLTPHTDFAALDQPGWLIACSDGLWNYYSDPGELHALVERTQAQVQTAEGLAEALVDAAKAEGGRDNITVVVVRVDGQEQGEGR